MLEIIGLESPSPWGEFNANYDLWHSFDMNLTGVKKELGGKIVSRF